MSTSLAKRPPDSVLRDLVTDASIEILPREVKKLEVVAPKLKKGTRVYVAYTSGYTDEIIDVAEAAANYGLVPVPHFPARRFGSEVELRQFVEKLAKRANVTSALVIAGDIYDPLGPYSSSLSLLNTGVFQANGIRDIGFAGHPEGHPDVKEDVLRQALTDKCNYAVKAGMNPYVATQFLFDVRPLVSWQANFIETTVPGLPVDLGVPGFAKISTLLKFANNCGVSTSLSMLTKHAGKALMLASAFSPEKILQSLTSEIRSAGKPIFRSIHLYPFGSLERTVDWLQTLRHENAEINISESQVTRLSH